ncbi:MAG: proline--tRNA ligase [Vulcanimicrobiota bacterium]
MKVSQLFCPTSQQGSQKTKFHSYNLLISAGYIRQVASGIFTLLPMGRKVVNKIFDLAKKELEDLGMQELEMPSLLPAEILEKSQRWEDPLLYKITDRNGKKYGLAPTHEELITELAGQEIRSYRELPLLVYQIATKFRDEEKTRGGLLKTKEFMSIDAYTFHDSAESLELTYKQMSKAFSNVFKKCGLEVILADADPGAIGGDFSQEFLLKSKNGDTGLFMCNQCGYAANLEVASFKEEETALLRTSSWKPEKVHTPNARTVKGLCEQLNIRSSDIIKALLFKADDEIIMALVRGDRELSQFKLKQVLKAKALRMANPDEIREVTGGPCGFSGPVGIENIRIIADREIKNLVDAVAGANEEDYHIINVTPEEDFKPDFYTQLRMARKGDRCPACSSKMEIGKVLELGHIFKLGTYYSQLLNATYTDENREEKPFIMGSYGLGVSRLMAAVLETEKYRDKSGIIWPVSIAPYQVIVIPAFFDNDFLRETAIDIYTRLKNKGIEVIIDDREKKPGFKLKEANLMGYPVIVMVGKKAEKEKLVEIIIREQNRSGYFEIENVENEVYSILWEKKQETGLI